MAACSTKKNTLVTRTFHNITSRFNGYYYSKLNVNEGVDKIAENHKEDYTKLLPLFVYADPKSAQSTYENFDKSIEKSSLVVQRHTITTKKGIEIPYAVKWIKYNYLLIGEAHFYKRDFFSALESFDYVAKEYKKSPLKYEAMMWEVRTYNEMEMPSSAGDLLDFLYNEPKFPKKYKRDLALVSADFCMHLGNDAQAIKWLTKAIVLTHKKRVKARYAFILGQLYARQKNTKKAVQLFKDCIKWHPSYDMVFNARMNIAGLFDISDEKNAKLIKKQLEKMLTDSKNNEYRDQIYYALAEIAEREQNIPLTINYLKLSVRASFSNNNQKARSYLKLADIFFDAPEYKLAQAYYDSTVTLLPKDYPNYELIVNKKENLTVLVKNLDIISRQDSLLKLARMSEKDRDVAIDTVIARVKQEEEKKAEEKLYQQQNNNFLSQNNQQTSGQQADPTIWYFYNQTTVGFGISEFVKKWGNRPLEDDWRRSTKQQQMTAVASEDSVSSDSSNTKNPTAKAARDPKNRAYYLKDIPLTEPEQKKATDEIIEAYFNLGSIYKEQLENDEKAISAFETLNSRFQKNKYEVPVYYRLYRLYLDENNTEKADYYKNILLNNYPQTEYAKIIKNPEYEKENALVASEVDSFYVGTYKTYQMANYSETLNRCRKADSLYSKSILMPKFSFLEALCIGRTQDVNAFQNALQKVTIKYPKDPVSKEAQNMLNAIQLSQHPEKAKAAADSLSKADTYTFDKDADYYWVIVVNVDKFDENKFKSAVSDMNNNSFSSQQLGLTSILMGESQLIYVKKFSGMAPAMNYYNFINEDKDILALLTKNKYNDFMISEANFRILYATHTTKQYSDFFTKNFLQK